MDRSVVGLVAAALLSWPVTLRLVFLLAVLATGTAVVAVKLGIVGQVVLLALGYLGRRGRRVPAPEGDDGDADGADEDGFDGGEPERFTEETGDAGEVADEAPQIVGAAETVAPAGGLPGPVGSGLAADRGVER